MIYVGIDIAKQTHYAAIVNSDGEVLAELFFFTNDHSGFQKLLKHLDSLSVKDTSIHSEG
ncbi:MAG: transposase [Lachnospiraceae bacterium]|nr:transposase [Lachnospiraceae bacterium]